MPNARNIPASRVKNGVIRIMQSSVVICLLLPFDPIALLGGIFRTQVLDLIVYRSAAKALVPHTDDKLVALVDVGCIVQNLGFSGRIEIRDFCHLLLLIPYNT